MSKLSTDELTNEQLAEIEARVANATPGPWHHDDLQTVEGGTVFQQHLAANIIDPRDEYGISPQGHCDADFIAHARTDIPLLIAEIRRLRGQFRTKEWEPCDVCAGKGDPETGRPCICGGTGSIYGQVQGLRAELRRLRAERLEPEERELLRRACMFMFDALSARRTGAVDREADEIMAVRRKIEAARDGGEG